MQGESVSRRGRVEAWEPNYCNDTTLQDAAGLKKTALGQFLGYDCDADFFHCRFPALPLSEGKGL